VNRDIRPDTGRPPLARRRAVGQGAILLMVLRKTEKALNALSKRPAHLTVRLPLPTPERQAEQMRGCIPGRFGQGGLLLLIAVGLAARVSTPHAHKSRFAGEMQRPRAGYFVRSPLRQEEAPIL
jgi:hypothetical protein